MAVTIPSGEESPDPYVRHVISTGALVDEWQRLVRTTGAERSAGQLDLVRTEGGQPKIIIPRGGKYFDLVRRSSTSPPTVRPPSGRVLFWTAIPQTPP